MPRVSKLRSATQQGNASDASIACEDIVEALLEARGRMGGNDSVPEVVVSGSETMATSGSSALKYVVADGDGEGEDACIESPALLLDILKILGMVHMTLANAEHVYHQILVSRSASSSPGKEGPPSAAVVCAKDVVDWIDAIKALDASEAPLGGDDDQPANAVTATVDAEEQALAAFVFATAATPDDDLPSANNKKKRAEAAATATGGAGLLTVPGGVPAHSTSAKQASSPSAPQSPSNPIKTAPKGNDSSSRALGVAAHDSCRGDSNARHPSVDAALHTFLQRAVAKSALGAQMAQRSIDGDALLALLEAKGVEAQVVQLLQRAVVGGGETTTINVATGSVVLAEHLHEASTDGSAVTKVAALERRTLAFASALSLKHVASGSGASMGIVATLMFVDISGYSAVTSALEGLGAHAMSAVVNGYLQKIVRVVRDHGGDVVKFAGDALLALWFEGSDVDNCSSAVRCAIALQAQCGTEPIPNTTLSFGLHCGISHGDCRSRIFAPRKLRSNDMPSHFHFLSGEPLTEVGEACSLAERGSTVVHQSVLDTLLPYASSIQVAHTDTDGYERIVDIASIDDSTAVAADWPMLVPPPDKSAIVVTAAGSATQVSTQQQERCFIPPKVASVLDSGMDQFFMAEMRELVVLFVQFAETTEVEVWFDEVFHILESFGCDVVQIIDDDKGVHIVAALNLYLMAEQSVDAAIGIALAMRAKHCDARVGAAAGTVFCGVLGSAEACQWDISGPACVRAARLMQHAVVNDLSACFDGSIFEGALDRSNLKTLPRIAVKGSPEPVAIYTLRDINNASSRASVIQVMEKIPTLAFHQSLCPSVHRHIIADARTALELPNAEALALAAAMHRRRKSERLSSEGSSALSSAEDRKANDGLGDWSRTSSMHSQTKSHGVINRHDTRPRRPRIAVLMGSSGTGKFSTAINILSESNTIPIVHECYERQSLVQLLVVHTISLWFTYSKIPTIKVLADRVLSTFREHRQNEAFGLTLDLLTEVCRNAELHDKGGRFAIVVRAAQFLDQSSVSFLGAAAKRFEDCNRIVFLVTCAPLYGYPEPEKKFVAFGNVKVYELKSLDDDETAHLFAHTIQQKPDSRLMQFVCSKTSNHVECIVELGRYLRRCAVLNLGADGFARMRLANIDEVERMLWGDISSVIRRKAVHILDHLTPELLTMCKIIAAITEQPLITAFFYSVSKVCETLQRAVLNVDNVRTLDAIWLLRMCEHKCTAHTGSGELDAAVFLVPAMRDIVLAMLVPQQRVAINKICGDCYHETHPMDHPMQFLVRARHYLFCSMHDLYVRDMRLGWGLILKMPSTAKDVEAIKARYYDWMRELDPNEVDDVLHHNPDATKGFDVFMRKRRLGFATSQRASTRLSNVHNQDTRMLRLMQSLSMSDVYPLELGPARPAYLDVLRMVQLLIETADTGMVSLHAATLEEEGAASMASVLDQVSGALSGYSMSVAYCLEGNAVSRRVGDAVRNACVALKSFVVERLDCEETHQLLCETATSCVEPSSVTEARAAHIKALALGTLELLDEHLCSAIQPLCVTLCDEADALLDDAVRMSVVIRRRVAFAGTCAFAQACRSLREDASNTERGDLLASLFEHLPTILDVYAPSSERLQRIFCDGLEAFYRGTLQPPETHMRLRGTLAVFWYSWLNCCTQQLLFH